MPECGSQCNRGRVYPGKDQGEDLLNQELLVRRFPGTRLGRIEQAVNDPYFPRAFRYTQCTLYQCSTLLHFRFSRETRIHWQSITLPLEIEDILLGVTVSPSRGPLSGGLLGMGSNALTKYKHQFELWGATNMTYPSRGGQRLNRLYEKYLLDHPRW